MDFSGILKGLKLDVWYKVFVYLGGIVLVLSFFIDVKGISNLQLQLLAGGCLLIGMGEWKNHKHVSWIKPPNIYTGPAARITKTIREPDFVGVLLNILGVVLLGVGILSVINSAISSTSIQSPLSTSTPPISQLQSPRLTPTP
jgi:hypothetical protein